LNKTNYLSACETSLHVTGCVCRRQVSLLRWNFRFRCAAASRASATLDNRSSNIWSSVVTGLTGMSIVTVSSDFGGECLWEGDVGPDLRHKIYTSVQNVLVVNLTSYS